MLPRNLTCILANFGEAFILLVVNVDYFREGGSQGDPYEILQAGWPLKTTYAK